MGELIRLFSALCQSPITLSTFNIFMSAFEQCNGTTYTGIVNLLNIYLGFFRNWKDKQDKQFFVIGLNSDSCFKLLFSQIKTSIETCHKETMLNGITFL